MLLGVVYLQQQDSEFLKPSQTITAPRYNEVGLIATVE